MEQVKIFDNWGCSLESKLNEWLKQNKPEITRVLQSSSEQITRITVFYKVKG